MKNITLKTLALAVLSSLMFTTYAAGPKKAKAKPVSNEGDSTSHIVDTKFVGKWLWTKGSNSAYYNSNGVYNGAAYGMAVQLKIDANGYGTCFKHIFSNLGVGSYLEVNISYNGFFESDAQGHLGFFPTSGTYKSTGGENRALRPDELWDAKASTGAMLYQKVNFTTQGSRECFQVTASNGVVDTYFRVLQ